MVIYHQYINLFRIHLSLSFVLGGGVIELRAGMLIIPRSILLLKLDRDFDTDLSAIASAAGHVKFTP